MKFEMKFENRLTRLLGVKYPIIQGAFGWPGTGGSEIAVPVSEAGGLGIMTTICYKSPQLFEKDLQLAKSLTDKPFGVNFSIIKGTCYDSDFHKDYVEVALQEGIKTIFTSASNGSQIGHIFQEAGCHWIHKCATIKHAVSAADKGADAVVIVGLEGTGFKSREQNTTLINMTNASRMIKAPVVAAGGIADGKGLVAALAMGAEAIYMGTAFMATKEFKAPDTLKDNVINQKITDPAYIRRVIELEHGGLHSFASGVIDSLPSVKEFINRIIAEATETVARFNKWGMLPPK